jgi:hypothetical protein
MADPIEAQRPRIIQRDQLVSWMSDTKWRELIGALPKAQIGRFRALSIGDREPGAWQPGPLWPEHLPWWSMIEWLELDPRTRPAPQAAVRDHTAAVEEVLRDVRAPFTREQDLLRLWGYTRPGRTPEFQP